MKIQKIVKSMLIAMVTIGMCYIPVKEVKAEEAIVEGSKLTMEESSVGYTTAMTRGVYLQSGESAITKAGSGMVYANGATTANMSVSTISVNVILERSSGGSWVRVTSWTATKNNTYYVSSTKTISVGSGYYYRVRSLHSANSDSSSSYTNGLYI